MSLLLLPEYSSTSVCWRLRAGISQGRGMRSIQRLLTT